MHVCMDRTGTVPVLVYLAVVLIDRSPGTFGGIGLMI